MQNASNRSFMSGWLVSMLVACVLISSPGEARTDDTDNPASFVIIDAQLNDGSGGPPRIGNVRVSGDRIAAVGDFAPADGELVVDGEGLILAPGFVDTHSHHDDVLLEQPGALGAVSQGITTIVVGQDGGHNYPLSEFFEALENSPAAVNVASMAGFGTIRGNVLGEDYQRLATPAEIEAMVGLLENELDAGALGLSSGLEYDPGSFSSTDEVVALASAAADRNGRYITHMRSEDRFFWEAVDEAIEIGRRSGIPVRITHAKLAIPRSWGQTDRFIARLDEARAQGLDLTVDVYPYEAWNTYFSWLVTQFPDRDLDRREGADFILEELLTPEGTMLGRYFPNRSLDGMTIAEIATMREADPSLVLMELLKADVADGSRSDMIGFCMQESDIKAIMAWPHAVIGSDGELNGMHPRGFGTFPRFLGHFVREQGVMSSQEAVRRISAMPAEQSGIRERGQIREGWYADLVLYDAERIIDHATYESPRLPSTGIEKVWVNGQLVFAQGSTTEARPGRIIRRSP